MTDPAYTAADFAEASRSPDDFWLVYRVLMAQYDASARIGHMTTFADEVAALAVSALAKAGRLLRPDAEEKWVTEPPLFGGREHRRKVLSWPDGSRWLGPLEEVPDVR